MTSSRLKKENLWTRAMNYVGNLSTGVKLAGLGVVTGTSIPAAKEGLELLAQELPQYETLINYAQYGAFAAVVGGTLYTVGNLVDRNKKLEQVAYRDEKTGLLNMEGMTQRLTEEHVHVTERRRRDTNEYSMLFLDLDWFKPLNDLYGYDVGDTVLRGLANVIKSSLRKDDSVLTKIGDIKTSSPLVSRIQGDEFAVLLPHTHEAGAHIVLNRIKKKFDDYVIRLNNGLKQFLERDLNLHFTEEEFNKHYSLKTSISGGIATEEADTKDMTKFLENLLKQASEASKDDKASKHEQAQEGRYGHYSINVEDSGAHRAIVSTRKDIAQHIVDSE
jgi:diguanylate cyclase (GGDEF)-like protein